MEIFLQRKNYELAKEVLKRLEGYRRGSEKIRGGKNLRIWKKELNNPYFYILFKPEWLTFALRVKDEKDKKSENEARNLLKRQVFDKYNLTPVKEEFFDNKWVYRNFYYPDARAYKGDLINILVAAFKELEKCVEDCNKCALD